MEDVMKIEPRLSGKVAIVTGAAGGIGRAIALRFAKEGAQVLAVTRQNLGGLSQTRELAGGAIEILQVDMAQSSEVEAMVHHAETRFGRLDILCNNAATLLPDATIVDTTEDNWDTTMNINLKSMFLGCKYAIPAMIRSGGGSIINLGSVNSLLAEPLHIAYCASKAGALLVTKCVAIEYAKQGIRANVICPGWIDTPMNADFIESSGGRENVAKMLETLQPLGLGNPDQIATVAAFLASEEASLVTGATIMVDGGLTAHC